MAKLTNPRSAVRRFGDGILLLGQGLRLWITSPRMMLLGALPALIVALVYLAGIIVLIANLDNIADAIAAFSKEWSASVRPLVHALVALAILAGSLIIVVYTFTAVTLGVGGPFYERIARQVEQRLGRHVEPVELGFWGSIWRAIADTVPVLLVTLGIGVVLFAGGFIPVIGQTVVPVLAAVAGGWFIALELATFTLEAAGHDGRARRRLLATDRATALGFGVVTYLLFLVPFAAVIVMPAAVAGATLLGQRALDARASGIA